MSRIYIVIILLLFSHVKTLAQDHSMHMNMNDSNEAMKHKSHLVTTGPIGVMGDHLHHKGSFMISYRLMGMNMSGVISSSSAVEDAEVFNNYMISPQSMSMNMHMIGAMYAVSDRFTLMAMSNFLSNDMALKMRMGTEFETRSSGFGDISLTGLIKLTHHATNSMHMIIGTSLPVGNINSRSDTPMSSNAILAYPMQLGSGTWDPFIGLNYSGQSSLYIWGTQGRYKHRISNNAEDYTLGSNLMLTAWGAIKISDQLNFSLRTCYKSQGKIQGANLNMNEMMMPLFDASNSGSEIVMLGTGVNYFINKGNLKGVRLGIEVGYNVYQQFNGYQMDQKLEWNAGVQYVLGQNH